MIEMAESVKQHGIQNLADCMQIAQCESPVDIDAIKLALQGYNYGQGYITWAMNKYGGTPRES